MAAIKRRSNKGGGGGGNSGGRGGGGGSGGGSSSSNNNNNSNKTAISSSSSSAADNNNVSNKKRISSGKSSSSFFAWMGGGGASKSRRGGGGGNRRHDRMGYLSTSTIQAATVLILAIITALIWNSYNDPVDPVVDEFLQKFCNYANNKSNNKSNNSMETTYCNQFLVTTQRTQKTIRDIPNQQRIVQIPRNLMIFDLDALRSPFIRQEFLNSPVLQQQQQRNSLNTDAFLAVHLALLQQTDENNSSNATSALSSLSSSSGVHPLLLDYVRNVMPSYQYFVEHHPILWPDEHVRELLGVYMSTYHIVRLFRQSTEDEYQLLSLASKTFAQTVSWKQYIRARLCVMTRSFGTGPLQDNERQQQQQQADGSEIMTLAEELALYAEKLGLHSLEKGSHALVPVLDLYNHHATPTVGYVYDNIKRAFVITSLGIPAGHEVFDSYGKHTDAHLFARYGFVSGDGSEYSQSRLSIWHDVYEDIMDPIHYMDPDRVVARSRRILRYLQFDDGYHECITKQNNHDAYQLKILKFLKLSQMAHMPTSFTFILGPRNRHATAPATSQYMSSTSMTDLSDHKHGESRFDANAIFGTCRLLTVTHRDYNGSATQLLQSNLYNATYILPMMTMPPPDDENDGNNDNDYTNALEFRTILCVTRLAREALRRFNVTIQQQKDVVLSLSNKEQFGSRLWMAAHLRLSEMQNLDFLIKIAFGALQNFPNNIMNLLNTEEDYWMREEPCPVEVAIDPYIEHLKPPPTVVGSDDDDDEQEETTTTKGEDER